MRRLAWLKSSASLLVAIAAAMPVLLTSEPISSRADGSAAADNRCLDPKVADSLILDYGVSVESFGLNRWDLSGVLCDREAPLHKMLETLRTFRDGKFKPYAGGFVQESYLTYFQERSPTIVLEDPSAPMSACPKDTSTYLLFACHTLGQNSPIWLRPNFFDDKKFSASYRVSTLVHESRHADGFNHVKCTRGRDKGVEGACDDSYEDGGSYAVETEYLARVATLGQNFSPTFVQMARAAALYRLSNKFNTSYVLPQDESLILLEKGSGRTIIYDGTSAQISSVGIPDANYDVVSSGNVMLTRLGTKMVYAQVAGSGTPIDVVGMPDQFEIRGITKTTPCGQDGLFFYGKSGASNGDLKIFALKPNGNGLIAVQSKCLWPRNFQSVTLFRENVYALTTDGIAVSVDDQQISRPVEALEPYAFSYLKTESYPSVEAINGEKAK